MAISKRLGKTVDPETRKRVVTYRIRVDRGIDPATGKRSWECRTARTKAEAEAVEAELKARFKSPTRRKAAKHDTVADVLDRWLEMEAPRLRIQPENLVNYEIMIRVHIKPALGKTLVSKLTVEDVERFYTDLHRQGKSLSLIRKCHLRLRSAMAMAVRHGLIDRNPCDQAIAPKGERRQAPEVWTRTEAALFVGASRSHPWHPMWQLCVETGARISEILGISWNDVDLEHGRVTFGRQVIRLLHGTPIVKAGAKTEAGLRTVGISRSTAAELRGYRARWNAQRLAGTDLGWSNPYELIFCSATGAPLNYRLVLRHFNKIVTQAGVKPISPHGMRKTHITAMIEAGQNPHAVASRVGHNDPNTTLRIYTAVTAGMNARLMEAVDELASDWSAVEEAG